MITALVLIAVIAVIIGPLAAADIRRARRAAQQTRPASRKLVRW